MIAYLSAPTNLGLRPPVPGSVPGTSKAPEALREAGLPYGFEALGLREAGVVLPGRYVDDDATRPKGRVRNQDAIIDHARRLAGRLDEIFEVGDTPLVMGGDCSLLIGAGVALSKRGGAGLVHIDGHTDFRHPGNSEQCASVAGEDLAAAVGMHWPAISDIDGVGPYFAPRRAVHIGHRQDDEEADEVRRRVGLVVSAQEAMTTGSAGVARQVREIAGSGYWLQIDVDVLDPIVMPAVDSPDAGGLDADQLVALLRDLAPQAVGASVTVFDPDLDPDGRYSRLVADVIARGLGNLGTGRVQAR